MGINGDSQNKTAQKAGLKKDDIVIKLGDSLATNMMNYMRTLSIFNKGDTNRAVVKRGNADIEKVINF